MLVYHMQRNPESAQQCFFPPTSHITFSIITPANEFTPYFNEKSGTIRRQLPCASRRPLSTQLCLCGSCVCPPVPTDGLNVLLSKGNLSAPALPHVLPSPKAIPSFSLPDQINVPSLLNPFCEHAATLISSLKRI